MKTTRKKARAVRKAPNVRVAPQHGCALREGEGGRYGFRIGAVDAAKHAPAVAISGRYEDCNALRIERFAFDTLPGTARFLEADTSDSGAEEFHTVVLESSRSYGAKDFKKHGDILGEAIGGALTAGSMRASRIIQVHPDEWAGSAPHKAPRHSIVWRLLTPQERNAMADALDAEQWLKLYNAVKRTRAKHAPPFSLEQVAAFIAAYIEQACEVIERGGNPAYSHVVHNLLDVAGLFLFAVGRMKRGGSTRGI